MTNGQEYKSNAAVEKNFMTYCDGDKLFHYTKFDSALKIIISNKLRFGRFEDMNDIAEVNRDIFANIPLDVVYKELGKYQSISLTIDRQSPRGFEINPLWGHYADKGKGICLVFDKAKLLDCLTRQIPNEICWYNEIHYVNNFSNEIFAEGESLSDVSLSIQHDIKSIFLQNLLIGNMSKSIGYLFIVRKRSLWNLTIHYRLLYFVYPRLRISRKQQNIQCLRKSSERFPYCIIQHLLGKIF